MHDHRDLMNVQRADAFVGADASLPGALDYRFVGHCIAVYATCGSSVVHRVA